MTKGTALMLEVRTICIHLVGHQQGKKQFGTASCVLQDYIKTNDMINNLN
jgi:hypothetical protein